MVSQPVVSKLNSEKEIGAMETKPGLSKTVKNIVLSLMGLFALLLVAFALLTTKSPVKTVAACGNTSSAGASTSGCNCGCPTVTPEITEVTATPEQETPTPGTTPEASTTPQAGHPQMPTPEPPKVCFTKDTILSNYTTLGTNSTDIAVIEGKNSHPMLITTNIAGSTMHMDVAPKGCLLTAEVIGDGVKNGNGDIYLMWRVSPTTVRSFNLTGTLDENDFSPRFISDSQIVYLAKTGNRTYIRVIDVFGHRISEREVWGDVVALDAVPYSGMIATLDREGYVSVYNASKAGIVNFKTTGTKSLSLKSDNSGAITGTNFSNNAVNFDTMKVSKGAEIGKSNIAFRFNNTADFVYIGMNGEIYKVEQSTTTQLSNKEWHAVYGDLEWWTPGQTIDASTHVAQLLGTAK